MLGWLREEADRASFSNRFNRSASDASSAGSTLIATSRRSLGSFARYTSPIPPAPMGARISYGPSREPAVRDTLAGIIGRSLPYPRPDRAPSGYLRGEGLGDGKATGPLLAFAPAFALDISAS